VLKREEQLEFSIFDLLCSAFDFFYRNDSEKPIKNQKLKTKTVPMLDSPLSFNRCRKLIQSFCLLYLTSNFSQNSKQTFDSINEFTEMVNLLRPISAKHFSLE
jgi:hypothetical protein